MKKILGIVIIILVALLLLSFKNKEMGTDKIKIGFIGPLSGEASPYGVPVKQGIELALENAVKKGFFQEGQVEIIFEDGKCDGKEATLAAQKLINIDKVKVIFGGQCSGETLAIAPIAESNEVLLISSFSTSPDVTNAGDFVFRVPPSDENSGKVIAQTIVNDGFEKVGIVSEQSLASQTIIPVFSKELSSLGSELIYNESFSSDSKDLTTIATKILSSNPEALYLNVQTGSSGSKVANALSDLGYQGQIYTYFITGDDFVKSGDWVNGIKIIDFQAAKNEETLDSFLNNFVEMFGQEPDYSFGATLGYDTGSIIFEAINEVGYNPDKLKKYLYDMESRPSITGDLSFDSNGDPIGNDVYYIRQIVDNELID